MLSEKTHSCHETGRNASPRAMRGWQCSWEALKKSTNGPISSALASQKELRVWHGACAFLLNEGSGHKEMSAAVGVGRQEFGVVAMGFHRSVPSKAPRCLNHGDFIGTDVAFVTAPVQMNMKPGKESM